MRLNFSLGESGFINPILFIFGNHQIKSNTYMKSKEKFHLEIDAQLG